MIASARTVVITQQTVPSDTVIKLEMTDCFFVCAAYVVTISAQGLVTFEGKKNVRVIGRSESRISPSLVQDLVTAFKKAKYFSMRDRYDRQKDGCRIGDGDAGSSITSIVIGGRSKSISHYYGCFPTGRKMKRTLDALGDLESKIDEVANADQWIK